MIDVNKITSTLAKLPDQQLQQYAQMHKSDPYIMALAMSESNRRKEMRAAGQGGQGMQEQPKVVDQMVAEMAPQQMPEDQGIGQLPAGEMNFAGGGIIAFADGGDVERYQVGGSIQSKYQQESQEMVSGNRVQYSPDVAAYAQQMSAQESAARNAAENTFLKAEQQRMLQGPYAAPAVSQRPTMANDPRLDTPRPMDDSFRRQTDPRMLGIAATSAAQPLITSGAAPKADTKPAGPRPAPTDTAAAPTQDKGVSGLDALVNNFTRSTELAQGALKNQRAGIASQLEQEALGAQEEGKKIRAARGDVFAKKEERLAEREKSIAGLGDKYMGLALLQAGAAMMSTPGNLGSVIGKGIAVGSERYIAGIDKINAAKDKFAEARDRLDDLRLNRDDMNEKEVRDENRAIRNARLQGQQLLVDGATKDLEISNANQKAIFGVAAENIIADKRIKSAENISANELKTRERIAQIPQGQERLAMLLGGGDLAKGLAKFTEIQAGKFNPTTAYTDYISKRKEGDTVLTPQEFVTQIRSIQALMGKSPPTAVDTSKPDRQ